MKYKIKNLIFILLSVCVSILVFIYFYKNVNATDVLELITNVDKQALVSFFILSLSMSFFRTWRYLLLLDSSKEPPNPIKLFLIVLVRNFCSDLLPARLGSAVYIYLANNRLGTSLALASSSFAVSFLFDIISICPIIIFSLIFFNNTEGISNLAIVLSSFTLLFISSFLMFNLSKILILLSKIISKLSFLKSHSNKIALLMLETANELKNFMKSGLLSKILTLSLLVRILKYLSLSVFLYGLLKPLGYTLAQLNFAKIMIGLISSELAASLPVSGIAGFGAYEGTWAYIFGLLGFPQNIANLTAVSHHLFTQVYGYLLGIAALIILCFPVPKRTGNKKISKPKMKNDNILIFFYKVALSLGIIFILMFGIFKINLAKSQVKQNSGTSQPSVEEVKKREAIANIFPGKILFDSNRSGKFGIYTINPDGTDLSEIINTNQHEMFPDISPDGKLIVYAKSSSVARFAPAEIWIANSDGKNQKLINDNGTFPSFSKNGQTIFFERERKKIMAMNIDGSELREIFPASNLDFQKYYVVKPRISSNGEIATFTSDKKGRWNAWYVNLSNGSTHRISRGCEPVPMQTQNKIAWITKTNVLAKSAIAEFDINSGKTRKIQDDGPPRGHEYFPSFAANDHFLLYSASGSNEHSHETANYQIYIKNLQTNEFARITFDSFTNRWPKIFPK